MLSRNDPFHKRLTAIRILILLNVLYPAIITTASAQTGQDPSPILTHPDSAEIWFDQFVSPEHSALVNGPEYYISFKGLKTHPFYQRAESDRSFVQYNNDRYNNIDLLYDIYNDILVYKCFTPRGTYFIALDKNLVQGFQLHHHVFKKYDSGISAGLGAYFDVLFEEKDFAIVAKRRKLERINGTISDYLIDDIYYLINNGVWSRISGAGSFSKLIRKDQRKELTAFLNESGIKVSKRKDEDLKKLGTFFYPLMKRLE